MSLVLGAPGEHHLRRRETVTATNDIVYCAFRGTRLLPFPVYFRSRCTVAAPMFPKRFMIDSFVDVEFWLCSGAGRGGYRKNVKSMGPVAGYSRNNLISSSMTHGPAALEDPSTNVTSSKKKKTNHRYNKIQKFIFL